MAISMIDDYYCIWQYCNNSYLCFERSKTQAGKNIVIPLERIRGIEKGNQYAWIPGGGMIIEVFVQGLDRVGCS